MIRIVFALLLAVSTIGTRAATIVPSPPQVAAKAYILVDANSGAVLAEQNADIPLPPASLTKMMTSYIVSDEIGNGSVKMDDEVRISEKAWRMGGSRMYIEVDKQVSVYDLMKGLIIQSGNDATVALAEHVAGTVEGGINAGQFQRHGDVFQRRHGLHEMK